MGQTLYDHLPRATDQATNDFLLGRFLDYVAGTGLELYPAQEAAILEIFEGRNVILNTPTGSGKSLVASALLFQSLAQGRRAVYTCPIKALVNEKWLSLCREFGPQNVALATGDATVNRAAPILCCTAEILANQALREGARADLGDVVMDEFHYYSDRDRGGAWQIPLLTLSRVRFLLLSATLGDTAFFEEELTRLNGRVTVTVRGAERPVPLEYEYAETPLAQTVENLVSGDRAPVYVVHFTQAAAAENAQAFTSLNVTTREQKTALARALESARFSSPYGPEIKRWLRHGIGLHHAGLLPRYRVLVEQLAQQGLLKVVCGTDTLGVGINVPIRTVLFTQMCKYDGRKTAILAARDFHQIAGRAGRKGYDDRGYVVAQAPEHVIENRQLEQKASGKKFVRRKPPEKGYVAWDRATFTRLVAAPPERLQASLQIDHGLLLNVLSRRAEDGCRALQRLIRTSHDSPPARKANFHRAWQLFRSLVERGIVEFIPRDAQGVKLRLQVDLQEDFSMHQALSLYLHDTLPLLDPAAPDYALVVLTLVESILEDPEVILRRQLDRLKGRLIAEWKAEGLDYNERMERLEEVEYPKPNREFVYSTFNAFAERHPWVGQNNIRPKSIAREMYEEFRSFADYVRLYEIQRAEGLLLRHLAGVYKALAQSVPDNAKNETLREIELYLKATLGQVDSSLLDEWQRMQDPNWQAVEGAPEVRPPGADEAARDITRDREGFLALARGNIFAFLRAAAVGDAAAAVAAVPVKDAAAFDAVRLDQALSEHQSARGRIWLDPEARNRRHTHLLAPEPDKASWRIQQMVVDPDGVNDWVAEFEVDLIRSRAEGEPIVRLVRFGPLDETDRQS